MELYTLDKSFIRQDIVEEFHSVIWTERFYGDSECEVVVPLKRNLIGQLAAGSFLAIDKSKEPMVIETFSIEEGKIKVVGISVLSWLNNRFVRASTNHRIKIWKLSNQKAGQALWTIVKQMCTDQSTILNGSGDMGLGNATREHELIIPGLKLDAYDKSGNTIKKIAVPYGPVYDALRVIAEQHTIGMQIWLNTDDLSLRFRSYKGINRTGNQTTNPIIRFSPTMDSLANIKELRSVADYKTLIYAYAADLAPTSGGSDLQTTPGIARRSGTEGNYTGFDLRAKMIFTDDIRSAKDLDEVDPQDTLAKQRAELRDVLNDRADKELKQNPNIQTVDGEVAPTNLFQYGQDYALGDLIEVQGNTDVVDISRVTEYIRSQDVSGEKAYPTVVAVDS